ncbi:MAG: DUF1697 domain-containing protein [Blastocatellia bacterium]|nr:DUF1697 domain-containing protein [Blastocatellia bacterium]
MPRYVAFLRAINVGGHTVKMDRLKKLFEELGLAQVETFIASGNVIFDTTEMNTQNLETKIASHLQTSLGYEVATFLRVTEAIPAIAAYQPFSTEDLEKPGHTLFVGFLAVEPNEATKQKIADVSSETDAFHIFGRELYWLCRIPSNESKFSGPRLEKTLGMPTTLRNVNTVKRIAAKFA